MKPTANVAQYGPSHLSSPLPQRRPTVQNTILAIESDYITVAVVGIGSRAGRMVMALDSSTSPSLRQRFANDDTDFSLLVD